jgi:hypothetical protein
VENEVLDENAMCCITECNIRLLLNELKLKVVQQNALHNNDERLFSTAKGACVNDGGS